MFNAMFKKQEILQYAIPQWIGAASNPHTPDAYRLCQRRAHLLFVYDELKEHFPKHQHMGDQSIQLCTGRHWMEALTEDPFCLWKKKMSLETQAIALPPTDSVLDELNRGKHSPAQIKGQLWAIRPNQFFDIDKYKENGVSFFRRRVTLRVPYQHRVYTNDRYALAELYKYQTIHHRNGYVSVPDEARVRAWMYVGIPKYWNDLLDGGFLFSPVRKHQPNNPLKSEYYHFGKEEYYK